MILGEAGGITQQIGATMVFRNKIIEKTEEINVKKFDLFLEGLLFIDTPGHESFRYSSSPPLPPVDLPPRLRPCYNN